jgi:HlyD family secretion protein
VEPDAYATVSPGTGDLEILVEASGSIEPIRNIEVKSLASGEITRLYVDVGDAVQPGDLLAEVDPRDVRTAFRQAEADLGVAEARLEISRTQLRRSEDLFEAGVITEQEVENARLDYQNNEASFIRSESNFELAELRLNDVTIRAPLAGTILAKNVEEGTVIQSASGNVSGGSVLFQMAALEQMQVRTNIDETDVGKIREGLGATLAVEAYPNQTFEGRVLKVEPQAVVQSNVVQFPVIITLDNSAGLLKPGMNADVEILIDQALNVMTVPNVALFGEDDVLTVATGLGLDPATVEISSGPAAAPTEGGEGGPDSAGRGAGNAAAGGPPAGEGAPDMAALRERIQSGELSREEIAEMMQSRRGGRRGATPDAAGDGGAMIRTSSAVVFVLGSDGVPRPRRIVVGLTDFDDTQVVSGLQGDEQLVILAPAQLMAQQQAAAEAQLDRRFGGGSPFGR